MISETKQEQAPIYKCRNLKGNLDCNLFTEIIQISLAQQVSEWCHSTEKMQMTPAVKILLIEHILCSCHKIWWLSMMYLSSTPQHRFVLQRAYSEAHCLILTPFAKSPASTTITTSKDREPYAAEDTGFLCSCCRRLVHMKVTLPVLTL